MKPQCIQAVETAIGRKLKANESADIDANIKKAMVDLARQDIDRWRNLSEYEKTLEASQHVGKMLEAEVKRKNKIAAMDIITLNKAMDKVLNHKKLSSMESLDRMIAFHGDMSGIQSVSKNAESIASLHQGRLHDLFSKVDGSLGLIQDKKYVRDFVKEAFGEDSGNPSAKKNAADFADVAADLKDRFNRNGGNIRTLEGWGLWTSWSPGKALEKGLDKWLELGLKNIDRNKAVHEDGRAFTEDELIDLLTASYKTIKSDGANKMEVGKANYSGNSKVTSRHAESRVLHWKDADAWMEMQSEFGDMPLIDIIDSNINRMAKEIALVEMFGSNPRENYKILKDAAAKKDKDERDIPSNKVEETASRIDDMFDDFTGSNIGSEFWANVGLAYRSVNTGAMLGGTILSSATDQAMIAKTAHVHGLSYWKIFGEMISQLNPKNKEDREFGYYLGIGVSELTGSISRWTDDGLSSVHGRAAKIANGANNIANQVLRLSGLQALTRASKVAFDTMLMAKYGDMTRNKSWNDLHPNDKELLEGTGLNERAWQVMQLAEPHVDRKGRKLMSARAIYAIPDEKLKALGDPQRIRDEVATQFQTHLLDEQGMAVIEAGLREKTKFTGGTKRGTLGGEFLRLTTQFKSFPMAFLMRHGSRAWSKDGWKGKAGYALPLVAMTTVLGGLVVQLKELANGNDPSEMWDGEKWYTAGIDTDFLKRSFVAGGGLPILGDILIAGTDTSGRDAGDFLSGPFGSDFKAILNLTVGNPTQALNGVETNWESEAFRFAKSKIPGQNLWYTKAATNRMIFDEMQDIIAPGYREKLLRKAEREHDRTRWLGDDWGDIQMPDFEKVID
ncbi:hypothetical protein [Acinetobacter baumannii]|uniref:hypothetical protein n=1 Tax=Acinetobacter baumannii TaxID=470 RepID=UPI001CDBD13E|nr:hypothetical protein [Acinetobacter baumannii]MCA4232779.1 hypothetical protein [Acinetobacter baumannii]